MTTMRFDSGSLAWEEKLIPLLRLDQPDSYEYTSQLAVFPLQKEITGCTQIIILPVTSWLITIFHLHGLICRTVMKNSILRIIPDHDQKQQRTTLSKGLYTPWEGLRKKGKYHSHIIVCSKLSKLRKLSYINTFSFFLLYNYQFCIGRFCCFF